ncbi:hypothetical protein WJX72_011133 [[Myrmecia] bisecta]|uniref:E3 ubiquitin-protein ligase listerin n=1 Tax=[Myrmecia] bisecta TaxID=41462 RepID=A0AAW1Q2M9_9CHLO
MSPKDRHSYKVASSAKAADLLSAAPPRAAGAFGFGGFSGSRPIDTVRSSSASELSGDAGAPEVAISSDLNAEIAQHLRRLSKRDRTTKLKALQGLNALLAERSIADLTATLPAWAYVYNRLVLDNDRAVRLEASAVLGRLAGRVSRALAPFLKTLAGPWWLAQFDPHADAAAAARAAFQQAFAGPKQREALLFCHAEVVAYLEESLNARPEALGDVRKESAEEVAERGERVQAAALLALASLLDVCGPQQQPQPAQPPPGGTEQQAVVTRVQAVVGQAGFSKRMLASKSPLVRRAAYTLVTHLCTRALEVVLALDLGALVLGSFSDKDAGNHGAMWEMVLTYVRLRPDAWQAPHVQKMVLPRLHAFLRHGCYGSALTSYPAVLPLLSLMPQAVLGPEPGLLVEVLESIWAGRDGLAAGPAQDAAALAFQDCLRYGLTQAATLAGSAGPAAEAFGQALLQASFSRQVLPAGLQGSGAAPNAALRVVVAVAQHAAAAGPGSWQCRATLQHIGSAAVAALAAGLAASLLAALVKRFGASLMNGQAHGGVQQGNLPASSGEELTAADVAQRSVAGAAEGAIAEANADLLLSCLQRSPQAAEELASLCTQAAQTESEHLWRFSKAVQRTLANRHWAL